MTKGLKLKYIETLVIMCEQFICQLKIEHINAKDGVDVDDCALLEDYFSMRWRLKALSNDETYNEYKDSYEK
jgi:hypothetical protein